MNEQINIAKINDILSEYRRQQSHRKLLDQVVEEMVLNAQLLRFAQAHTAINDRAKRELEVVEGALARLREGPSELRGSYA